MKDRTAVNHNIRKHFNELIYNTARYTEIVLSIVIIIVIALSGLRLILTTAGTSIMDMDTSFFTSFLSQALSLVVGVEFVKMLCRHSAQTVVEVLLFATARQMVVEHLDPVQTLIGIIGIAILFAVRKYLMTDSDDMKLQLYPDIDTVGAFLINCIDINPIRYYCPRRTSCMPTAAISR